MTPEELVAAAEAVGLTLELREGGVLHVAPRERLTPALREGLKATKTEVLRVLRVRAFGLDWRTVRLADLDRVLEIAVPWSDTSLLLVPGCKVARELRATDPKPGRVWCVCEIRDLLLSGVTPEDARTIAAARLDIDATQVSVRTEKEAK